MAPWAIGVQGLRSRIHPLAFAGVVLLILACSTFTFYIADRTAKRIAQVQIADREKELKRAWDLNLAQRGELKAAWIAVGRCPQVVRGE